MYYVEETINGKLHYKNSPNGKWIEFSSKQLNKRIADLEESLLRMHTEQVERETANRLDGDQK